MALFKLSNFKFLHRSKLSKSPKSSIAPKPPASKGSGGQSVIVPNRPKSLTQLEREIEAEQRLSLQSVTPTQKTTRPARGRSHIKTALGMTLVLAIPVGIIAVLNLPYAVIRRPVAEEAPILLLPSYISVDHHYRLAINNFEQAQQLIDNATTPADLALGEQKLDQAQISLDAIPLDWVNGSYYLSYSAYDWSFSPRRFNETRAEAGRLKARVFQEKNAQTAFSQADQSVQVAQQQYSQAETVAERQAVIAQWQTALDQLQQIPAETLAGQSAQQKLLTYERDFQDVSGSTAGDKRAETFLSSAREYSHRAAVQGQNPPHTAEEWQQIAQLWEEAIAQVDRALEDDLSGYAEANKMRAEYQKNLGQIQIRLEAEQTAVSEYEQAQQKMTRLLASSEYASHSEMTSQLQSIIDQLSRVKPGTTVYADAQADLLSAQRKLAQSR
jgi:hypothetical protein